jgi:hypothetical protein
MSPAQAPLPTRALFPNQFPDKNEPSLEIFSRERSEWARIPVVNDQFVKKKYSCLRNPEKVTGYSHLNLAMKPEAGNLDIPKTPA